MTRNESCKDRVRDAWQSRRDDLTRLLTAFSRGDENVEDLGNIFEYGLCFDYVAPETFDNQREGYFRYQLSHDGPSEEIRFYVSPFGGRWGMTSFCLHRAEFWLLDWFDGAPVDITDDPIANDLWPLFEEFATQVPEFRF